jgi:pimeloyl-[acyl-carrier protein] methyl ester esterase
VISYLLLPGMDGTGELFAPFVRALGEDVRAEVVRYPRDQVTRRAELADLAEAAAPAGKFVIVAESYSGAVGLSLAARAPAGLLALVLVNSFVTPPAWPGFKWAPLELMYRRPPPPLLIRYKMLGSGADPSLVDAVGQAIATVAPAVLAARAREVLETDARQALAACPVPLLYLRGTGDRLVSDACAAAVKQNRPDVTWQEINGPHLLLQRCPDPCAAAVEAFVSGRLAP